MEQDIDTINLGNSFSTKKNMQTDLSGRLRNFTGFDKNKAPLCLYEAVTNGFQSYPESAEKKIVKVVIEREKTIVDQNTETGNIVSITVQDSGVGFNEDNFESFKKLDFTNKLQFGCKGVGRLTWLKVFGLVEIQSIYEKDGKKYQRIFSFSAQKEIEKKENKEVDDSIQTGTTVVLKNRIGGFLEGKFGNKEEIKKGLISHFLLYLLEEGNDIELVDVGEKSSLKSAIEQIKEKQENSTIEVDKNSFNLKQILLNGELSSSRIAWCANKRVVRDDINGLSGLIANSIKNHGAGSTYVCLVESNYLNERVSADRTSFQIPEQSNEPDFLDLSMQTIRSALLPSINLFLSDLIEKEKVAGVERIENFAQENPGFKPLIDFCQNKLEELSSKATDQQLKKFFRSKEAEIKDKCEERIKQTSEKLNNKTLKNVNEAIDDLYKALMSDDAVAIHQMDLVNYVVRRKAILQCLTKALEIQDDGKHSREAFIHNLIVPMRCDSSTVYFDDANLWLIDERLAFHNYLASDIPLSQYKVAKMSESLRPDIASLNLWTTSDPIAVGDGVQGTVEIVEFKRPMAKQVDGVFQQVLEYAKRIANKQITSYAGRPVTCDGPYFAYIVTDITKELEDGLISDREFNKVEEGFLYKAHKAKDFTLVVEVLSYDYLLKRANQRNQAFFRKLGLD